MKNFDIDLYTIEELMTLNKQVVNKQEAMVTHISPKKNPSDHAEKAGYLEYFSNSADFRT
ncbi:MAG: hypothetical protein WCN27_00185 [Alphaproteobacteria bacterium]